MAQVRQVDELHEMLNEQMSLLVDSCESFDQGKTSHALPIAVRLRVLLHDTTQSRSLLGLLGIKDDLWFLDSAGELNPQNLAPEFPLCFARITMTETAPVTSYEPSRGDGPPRRSSAASQQVAALLRGKKLPRSPGMHIKFADWWEQPVIKDSRGKQYSRKALVMVLANKDGGAHVDPKLDDDYHALSKLNSIGLHAGMKDIGVEGDGAEQMLDPATDIPFGSPVPGSVRQIAWEFQKSIEHYQGLQQPTR